MSTRKQFLYSLTDPRNDELRYIGISNDPTRRKAHHLRKNEKGVEPNPGKYNWITELINEKHRPKFKVIAVLTDEEIRPTERRLVDRLRKKGAKLLNLTKEEVAARYSKSSHWKKATVEMRKKHSAAIRRALAQRKTAARRRSKTRKP